MKYRYTHWRIDPSNGQLRRYRRGITKWEPGPRGGATLCQIHDAVGVIASGATECGDHSFSYKVGRIKAKFRADLARRLAEARIATQ